MDGATIGQYRITGVIGRGGMGVVYAAEHTLLGRPAAIKVLLPELSQKQDVVLRFFNEARAATVIRNPGIVEIYDFGWTPDGAAFIVMERLEGETLAKRVARGQLRWQLALSVARQIAGALGAAHAKGIIHRDLKPDNVFLVRDPEVPGGERIKLLDFGIAKLAGDTSPGNSVTTTGAVMGTPTYMSPEQCRGVAVDHRADLYALGCVVFELCSGRPPFVGEGAGDVLGAHIYMTPPTLASCGVAVPPAVEQLVQRLLAKPPGERVQTADELIRSIDSVVTDAGWAAAMISISAPPASATLPSLTTLSGSASTHLSGVGYASGRRRVLALAAGVAVVAVVAVIALVVGGGSAPIALVVRGGSAPIVRAPDVTPGAVSGRTPGTAGSTGEATSGTIIAAGEPAPAEKAAGTTGPITTEPAAPANTTEPAKAAPESAEPAKRPESTAPAKRPDPAKAAAAPATVAPESTPPVKQAASSSVPASSSPPATRPTTITVSVDSVPAGADVLLAGQWLGKTPYRGALSQRSDNVTLTLRLAGYADRSITVRGDRAINQRATLAKSKSSSSSRDRRDESVNPF